MRPIRQSEVKAERRTFYRWSRYENGAKVQARTFLKLPTGWAELDAAGVRVGNVRAATAQKLASVAGWQMTQVAALRQAAKAARKRLREKNAWLRSARKGVVKAALELSAAEQRVYRAARKKAK